MNRRNFLSVLGAAMAGMAAVPLIHVPELPDRHRWKRMQGSLLLVPNPEWVNAQYEIAWWVAGEGCGTFIQSELCAIPPWAKELRDKLPRRFKQMSDGTRVEVHPFQVVRSAW